MRAKEVAQKIRMADKMAVPLGGSGGATSFACGDGGWLDKGVGFVLKLSIESDGRIVASDDKF